MKHRAPKIGDIYYRASLQDWILILYVRNYFSGSSGYQYAYKQDNYSSFHTMPHWMIDKAGLERGQWVLVL